MPADHILVIAVDGLRASALGAYGNTSYPTPTLDRLAAESFLLDASFAGSTDLPNIYRQLWQSAHSLRSQGTGIAQLSLPKLLAARGYATTLVTDEPEVTALETAAEFDQCVRVAESAPIRAEDVSQTALAQLFAAACDAIDDISRIAESFQLAGPQLVWVHSRGMYGPWDAPTELQASLLDEGDPAPHESLHPPDLFVPETDDPDKAFVASCAYAAQVMVLDACVDGLVQTAQETWPECRWMLMLLGVRGFPLGEHRRVGGIDPRLFVEQLHVPWLVRMSDGTGRLARSGRLTSHVDLLPTLLDWVGGDALAPHAANLRGVSLLPLLCDPCAPWRDAVVSCADSGGKSLRTHDWSLRCKSPAEKQHQECELSDGPADRGAKNHELYVRPDDRWEANDVAELCPHVVEELVALLQEA